MPFHLSNPLSIKYLSNENQKIHEYEYKKFIKTLQLNTKKTSKEKFCKHRSIYLNNNYLLERQINLQYRQDKRKHEYERIQKENIKFSRKLINAKAFLNRYEQEKFFDKHCKLKQRLQHYPDLSQNQIKKFPLKKNFKIINKPIDSTFSIYNNYNNTISKFKENNSQNLLVNINKLDITQKKFPHFIKHNSQMSKKLPPIRSIIQNTEKTSSISKSESNPSKNNLSMTACSNIINWNKSTNINNLKSISLPLKKQSIVSSLSSSKSNLSDLLI